MFCLNYHRSRNTSVLCCGLQMKNLILRPTDELVCNAKLGGPNAKFSRLFTSVLEVGFTAAVVHKKHLHLSIICQILKRNIEDW